MVSLYLDGVYDLTGKLEEYEVDHSNNRFSFKKDVWLRITILAHTALTLIRTIVVQFLRGTGNLLCGIIYLDKERCVMGLKDYLSFLIQAVVLPVLGILTLLFPKTGYQLLCGLRNAWDTPRQASDIVYKHEDNLQETLHQARQSLSDAIMGIFGFFTALIHTITSTIEYCLCLSFTEAWNTLRDSGRLIVIAPKEGFSGCCRKNSSKEIYSALRIAMETFHPSALY